MRTTPATAARASTRARTAAPSRRARARSGRRVRCGACARMRARFQPQRAPLPIPRRPSTRDGLPAPSPSPPTHTHDAHTCSRPAARALRAFGGTPRAEIAPNGDGSAARRGQQNESDFAGVAKRRRFRVVTARRGAVRLAWASGRGSVTTLALGNLLNSVDYSMCSSTTVPSSVRDYYSSGQLHEEIAVEQGQLCVSVVSSVKSPSTATALPRRALACGVLPRSEKNRYSSPRTPLARASSPEV